MRLNQDGRYKPADEVTGAMRISLEMVRTISSLLRRTLLVAGVIVIPTSALSTEERPHPSLVDPAITKCTVCHTSLGAAHTAGASIEDCLSCHEFVMRSKKTFLVVEDPQPGVIDAPIPATTDTEVMTSHSPPAAETAPTTDPTEEPLPMIMGGETPRSRDLYGDGMAAFNNGEFDHAFDTWRAMLTGSPDYFALQVEVDSLFVSAQSTFARYGDHSLFIVKKDDLYWVFSGLYSSQEKAIEALHLLPESLRQGGAFPVAVRQIVPRH